MSDIVEELRDRYPETILFTDIKHIAHEAAETIERLREATLRIEGQIATTERLLAESQAREKAVYDFAHDILYGSEDPVPNSWYKGTNKVYGEALRELASSDSAALDAAITKAKREVLLEAAIAADADGRGNLTGYQLRAMADDHAEIYRTMLSASPQPTNGEQ